MQRDVKLMHRDAELMQCDVAVRYFVMHSDAVECVD